MKLRWKKEYSKEWVDFVHEDGLRDGGYRWNETGEKVLQFYNEETFEWEDVPDAEKAD